MHVLELSPSKVSIYGINIYIYFLSYKGLRKGAKHLQCDPDFRNKIKRNDLILETPILASRLQTMTNSITQDYLWITQVLRAFTKSLISFETIKTNDLILKTPLVQGSRLWPPALVLKLSLIVINNLSSKLFCWVSNILKHVLIPYFLMIKFFKSWTIWPMALFYYFSQGNRYIRGFWGSSWSSWVSFKNVCVNTRLSYHTNVPSGNCWRINRFMRFS